MAFFLALRNIAKNKKNSAIIVLLIAVITFLFFTGNNVIRRVDMSIRRAFIESLTGDVALEKTGDITMNLFGANTPVIDSYFNIPVLPAPDVVMELAAAEEGVAGITSLVSGKAYMDLPGLREPVLLCGVDAESYFPLFPGIVLEEGRFLRAGEYGAMITGERVRRIEALTGQRPSIGAPLLFTSGGAMGFKIREVPLLGIFNYRNPGQFMNEIVIIDPQTVRVLNSIQVAGASAEPGEDASGLLGADLDDLFGEAFAGEAENDDAGFSVDFLENFLSESEGLEKAPESGGDWNFIILRLEEGVSAKGVISSLNRKVRSYGVTAVDWRTAAGTSAILPLLVQILFNSGMFLVSVAGVIAVINIFLISVFRRTREIGTLRAIGASDNYVRVLIFSENIAIALFAGFVGVLGGILFTLLVNKLDLRIQNELVASILGGPALRLDFLPDISVLSLIMAVLLGLAASIYPVEAAVRIEPMVAVRRG